MCVFVLRICHAFRPADMLHIQKNGSRNQVCDTLAHTHTGKIICRVFCTTHRISTPEELHHNGKRAGAGDTSETLLGNQDHRISY